MSTLTMHPLQSQSELPSEKALPQSFETIEEIKNMPNERLKCNPLVNVIGLVKDYQPPVKSRGTDWKCTVRIMDISSQFDNGIEFNLFYPEEKMPRISGVSDVVLVRKAKVQMYSGRVSLLTNWATEFHMIPASKIPKSPSITHGAAVWQSYPPKCKTPAVFETDYVIWANGHMDKSLLPSPEEFQDRSMQAMNVKDKFSLLKDLKSDQFYNVIGEVIKVYESFDVVTMYLSDYTPNSLFYNYARAQGDTNSGGRDGDEYGYVKYHPKSAREWPGPFGKMVIQITIYDPHARFVREQVKLNQWVLLKNLQVKMGKVGHLEGYLRGEQQREGPLRVHVMDASEERDGSDARWKEAVGRKQRWWKKFDQQKTAILEETSIGEKRKRDSGDTTRMNGKMRRKEKLIAAEGKVAAADTKAAEKLDLNKNIRCNHQDKVPLTLSEIQKTHVMTSSAGAMHTLPFINGNYKAHVRVVDFFPDKIEEFSIGRRKSDYDILSDYSGGEDTDMEEDMRHFREGKGFVEKKWEWRFALQVEDATSKLSAFPPTSTERLWLTVDNEAAQMLLGINEDATNLRRDSHVLSQVREKLYILWGDLEEHKSAQASLLEQQLDNPEQDIPPSSYDTTVPSSPIRKAGDQPDPDSDKENEIQQTRIKAKNKPTSKEDIGKKASAPPNFLVRNKAFTCCIKQYGVKVPEEDSSKANAGDGQRWERKFGLFGTAII